MCAGCFTTADALVWSSVFLGTSAVTATHRIRDRWFGGSSAARRRDAYEETAVFLRSLGLDAGEILGPAPVPAMRP